MIRDLMKERAHKLHCTKDEVAFVNHLASDGVCRKLLDLGCGAGFTSSAVSSTYEKYGLEVSAKAAEFAKQFIPHVHVGTLEQETYPAEFFDVVICYHVIDHVSEPIRLVETVHHIMKTHGHFVVSACNFDSGAARRFGAKYRLLHDPTHISLFSDYSLKQLLEDVGFIVDKIEYPFFDTNYFTEENLLRLFDTSQVSPPFYGNIFTLYARKK